MQLVCALVTAVIALAPSCALAADKSATVAVDVRIAQRTSLRVSNDVLQFVVQDGQTIATASVEFTVAARVARDGDVVLSVEPLRPAPGGGASITFAGDGDGTMSGVLASGAIVAAQWHGSGRRSGRLVFTLHARNPGVYAVPLELAVLTR